MNNLKLYKMGDILNIKHGFPFLGEFFSDKGDYIILTPGNFFEAGGFKRVEGKEKFYLAEFPEEYLCSKGDLVVAMTQQAEGLLGSTALIPEDNIYLHNQRIGLISFNEKRTNKLYLYYLFMTPWVRQQIRATASGSKVKHTSPERIYDVKVWLPSLPQQKAIASFIYTIDQKIQLNNTINAELEKAAKTLYSYWFVQFDFPNAKGKPYRTSGGKMEYNEVLKREIPKGWQVDKLEDKLNLQRGVEPGSDAYSEIQTETQPIPFIRVSDLGSNGALYISEDAANGTFCKPTDVLVSFDGSVGKVAIAMEGAFSSGIRKITGKNEEYSNALIYFIFQSEAIQKTIAKYAVGSNILHAAGAIEYLLFPYNKSIVKMYMERVEPIFQMLIMNYRQNKELTELRDILLPLLMNGQVRVREESTHREKSTVGKRLTKQQVFMRLVLAAYILDTICDEPTAGRVKFEKLLFLCLYCAQIAIKTNFRRQTFGPYDNKALFSIEKQLKDNKWFKKNAVKDQYRAYTRLGKSSNYKQYVETNFNPSQKIAIDKILHLFKKLKTEPCEIVATLYGAWNDFLIDGIQPTDEQIVDEVLTNWHDKKKRIDRQRWFKALEWMREKDIIPVGFGTSTKN